MSATAVYPNCHPNRSQSEQKSIRKQGQKEASCQCLNINVKTAARPLNAWSRSHSLLTSKTVHNARARIQPSNFQPSAPITAVAVRLRWCRRLLLRLVEARYNVTGGHASALRGAPTIVPSPPCVWTEPSRLSQLQANSRRPNSRRNKGMPAWIKDRQKFR